jgi:hypothetical protein
MTPEDILTTLQERSVALATRAGGLRVDAPVGVLTGELRAALRAQKAELVTLVLRRELHSLREAITLGCHEGHHRHLRDLWPEIAQEAKALIDVVGPDSAPDAVSAACHAAGPLICLAALVLLYQAKLGELAATGADTFRERAALELCLCHPVPPLEDEVEATA